MRPGDEFGDGGASRKEPGEEKGPGLTKYPIRARYPDEQAVQASTTGAELHPTRWRLSVTPGLLGVHSSRELPASKSLAPPTGKSSGRRGRVTEFSPKSRANLQRRLATLDYSPWLESFRSRLHGGNAHDDRAWGLGTPSAYGCCGEGTPESLPRQAQSGVGADLCNRRTRVPGCSAIRSSLAYLPATSSDDRRFGNGRVAWQSLGRRHRVRLQAPSRTGHPRVMGLRGTFRGPSSHRPIFLRLLDQRRQGIPIRSTVDMAGTRRQYRSSLDNLGTQEGRSLALP